MERKNIIRIAACAAAALLSAACIYPYEVELGTNSEYPLVIEGDINIGGYTTVKVSHVHPFNWDSESNPDVFNLSGHVEGEDGIWENGYYDQESGVFYIDTRRLSPNQRYRLVLETGKDGVTNQFESDWLTPSPAPTIDGLSYSKNDQFSELWIGLSMHCNGEHFFRWSFKETWEYHADMQAYVGFFPGYYDSWRRTYIGGEYKQLNPTYYYCWNSETSSQINIFSTAHQTEDRFEDLAFHTISLRDKRLQVMYKITVSLSAISEDAYNYWNNIKQGSSEQGSIFAPVPSMMASNIHCVTDPTMEVVGYLSASTQTEATMYYDNAEEKFFKGTTPYPTQIDTLDSTDITAAISAYLHEYRPYLGIYQSVKMDENGTTIPSEYLWVRRECVDCRREGGTKEKPEGWPTNHE